MAINENNSQINAFAKGMNSDTTYDQMDNQSYVYGKNVRITKNDFIEGDINGNNFSSVHEGIVSPLPKGDVCLFTEGDDIEGVFLGSDSINDIAVVITKTENTLHVYKAVVDNKASVYTKGFKDWWSCDIPSKLKDLFEDVQSVSTVMYQELEGVIKLYIATGVYPIIEIRVDDEAGPYESKQNVDYFINNRILPQYPVYIEARVDGQLKTSLVQYTYRYYNKFGTTTQLSPLTNKILVIDSNRSKETGNAQDTTTSVGFTLKIRHTNEFSAYKRLLIYRLSYIVPGEDAKVELIYDGDVDTTTDYFLFNDVGATPLQELTMQEFAAMSGMVIIPKVIEQNQQYLFASNIKDDTIIDAEIPNTTVSKVQFLVKLSTDLSNVPVLDESSNNSFSNSEIIKYFEERNINPSLPKNTYNNIFTSSLLRSLRRGESYKYGIVYYDTYGRHTNVLELEDSLNASEVDPVSEISNSPITTQDTGSNTLFANPIGVSISIPTPTKDGKPLEDIVGCLIVRRSCKPMYQKTLLLVAIAKPISQDLYTVDLTGEQWDQIKAGENPINVVPKISPSYPTGFLLSSPVTTEEGYYTNDWKDGSYCPAYTRDNKLYQAFSNEFDFRRDDIMSRLKSYSLFVNKVANYTISQGDNANDYTQQARKNISMREKSNLGLELEQYIVGGITFTASGNGNAIKINKRNIYQSLDNKPSEYMMFPLYYYNPASSEKKSIRSVKDVKIPQWFDGFSNIQPDGTKILNGGIKKYQQFNTNIDNVTFNNWISFGLYDFKISDQDSQQNVPRTDDLRGYSQYLDRDASEWMIDLGDMLVVLMGGTPHQRVNGYIGPGTSCFLFTLDEDNLVLPKSFGAAICNIQHDISKIDNEPDEFVQYFGFGNFFPLTADKNDDGDITKYRVSYKDTDDNESNVVTVFDGDIYITPHEIATMYKTYDFMSVDTLWSMQVINYVPMESKVNTFFDYGMNFLNTSSANLMTEPGSIEGITTQDRPVHQYNQIYSANDESNDVFTLIVEKSEDNNFKQRTYYSEPKTNGEYVDNFVIFKPAAYIDVDPKYGEITNLLTDKNTLYYWQNTAFGKFSVNERSLINDTNGNTIMLGQAGILSRNDYISTKYGMRLYDFCATSAENGVYWVDVNNKAVVGGSANECVNIGERLNVQNVLNAKMSTEIPRVDYDLLNNELLCKCLEDGDLMIFNLKLNIATSIYTRRYEDIITVQNHIYGYNSDSITKYNHLKPSIEFMSPMMLSFIVNPSASTTKVFDSQQLTSIKREDWDHQNAEDYTSFFEDSDGTLSFETDINKTLNSIEAYTDREGNIIYNIPRFGDNDWGNRLRGKWMRVNMNYGTPTQYTTISHVITKFRQSYS